MAHMFLISTHVYDFQQFLCSELCYVPTHLYLYTYSDLYNCCYTQAVKQHVVSSRCHAKTRACTRETPCTCTEHELHRVSSSADQLSSTPSPPRTPASFLICSCPLSSLPAAPVSPIKDEWLYNNSRHDSLTLTLRITELEVLGKPLM